MMCRVAFFAVLLASIGLDGGAPVRAEVEKHLRICEGGLCGPEYRAVIKPPEGWVEDKAAGQREGMVILLPQGETEDSAKVQIFAEAVLQPKKTSFERAMQRQIETWRKRDPSTTLRRIEPVQRRDGQPAFQLHRFEDKNAEDPSVGSVAWGIDQDRDGNRYLVVVVLTAKGTSLDASAEQAYLSVLREW